jgi:hypothetical protein
MTWPYADRVCVVSIKFEMAMSNAALLWSAAGAVPAINERKYMSQSKKIKSNPISNVRDTGA